MRKNFMKISTPRNRNPWQFILAFLLIIGMAACSQPAVQNTTQPVNSWEFSFSNSGASQSLNATLQNGLPETSINGQQSYPNSITVLFHGTLDALVFAATGSNGQYTGLIHLHRAAVSGVWASDGQVTNERPGFNNVSGFTTDHFNGLSEYPISFQVPKAAYTGTSFAQNFAAPYDIALWLSAHSEIVAGVIQTSGTAVTTGMTAETIAGKSAWVGEYQAISIVIVQLRAGVYYDIAGSIPPTMVYSIAESTVPQLSNA